MATVLEQETQVTITDWLRRIETDHLFLRTPLEHNYRASHLPDLFRDLVRRLRHPIVPGTRALASESAFLHGQLRRQQGYTASMLVEESRLLQVSIFHTLHINAEVLDFKLLLPDVITIADEVDSQLAQAVASYTSEPAARC